MLWDIVRDFFVKFIFGGTSSIGENFSPSAGFVYLYLNGSQEDASTMSLDQFVYKAFSDAEGYDYYSSISDYLSTIATIISMVVIVVLCCLLIKKIYNICAHIIG